MQVNPSYSLLRKDIIKYIPIGAERVLDVGCSTGALGNALKNRQQVYVAGIEYDQKSASVSSRLLDKVIVGNVDSIDLYKFDIPRKYFDCIVYGDVLEHCVNPFQVVKQHKEFLSDEGVVVASIPNVRHFTVILNLLKGDFPYRERGLHDKTHLRWFTKKTIIELFAKNGYKVDIAQRNYRIVEKNQNSKLAHCLNPFAKHFATILYPFREFFVFQYIILCKKA